MMVMRCGLMANLLFLLLTGNIVRISRESMRATWYPTGKMRYITPEEYRKAQYREEDIAIRNRSFGMNVPEEVPEEEEFYDPLAEDMARLEQSRPAVEVEQLEVSGFEPPKMLPKSHLEKDPSPKSQIEQTAC